MPSDTRERILDAALAVIGDRGLSGIALEDVAEAAGVSRQTLYRYFGSRDGLLGEVVLREERALIAQIVAATQGITDLRPALEAAFVTALRAAREHPLLQRLLATEPEALLPFLTSGKGPVLPAARPVISELLRDRLGHLSDKELERVADVATRLLISYAANPPLGDLGSLAADLADLFTNGVKPMSGH